MKSTTDNTNQPKGIHVGHRQRVKERFLNAGLDSFQLHEILEFLLFFGIPYKDTNPIAHNLIEKYGSFSGVFDAPIQSLKDVSGMTDNASVLIKALPAISRAYLNDKLKQTVYINSLLPCVNYLKTLFLGLVKEEMYVLLLDINNKLILHKKIASGSINEVNLTIRDIQETVFFSNASKVILAHNHPSGNCVPSDEDYATTKNIFMSLAYINVQLLDHVIVSNDKHYSFNREGLMAEIKNNCPKEYTAKFAESSKTWLTEE